MVRCWRGGNRAAPPPRSESSQRNRVQAPCLGFEFLSRLLDRFSFVWRLDGAEPHRLGGDLVDIQVDSGGGSGGGLAMPGTPYLQHRSAARRSPAADRCSSGVWGPMGFVTSTGAGATITGSCAASFLVSGERPSLLEAHWNPTPVASGTLRPGRSRRMRLRSKSSNPPLLKSARRLFPLQFLRIDHTPISAPPIEREVEFR